MSVPSKAKDDGGALLWMMVAAEIGVVVFGTMAAYALGT
jgi:hypothetical protein